MKKAITFTEWLEEEQMEVEGVSLSLHGNKLFVKNESGEFDIELTEEQVPMVTEGMQSLQAGGESEEGPEPEEDEEGGSQPQEMPMGTGAGGEPGQLGRKIGSLSGA